MVDTINKFFDGFIKSDSSASADKVHKIIKELLNSLFTTKNSAGQD
jgi:hypothetical protein